MAKIQLGAAPKTFTGTVKFQLLDGSEGEINFEFVNRTRKEYGQLLDDVTGDAVKAQEANKSEKIADVYGLADKSLVDFIMKAATGWDLEDKFTVANVAKLVDQFPAAGPAFGERYRAALLEGRTKN